MKICFRAKFQPKLINLTFYNSYLDHILHNIYNKSYWRWANLDDSMLFGNRLDFLKVSQSVLELLYGGLEYRTFRWRHEIIFVFRRHFVSWPKWGRKSLQNQDYVLRFQFHKKFGVPKYWSEGSKNKPDPHLKVIFSLHEAINVENLSIRFLLKSSMAFKIANLSKDVLGLKFKLRTVSMNFALDFVAQSNKARLLFSCRNSPKSDSFKK